MQVGEVWIDVQAHDVAQRAVVHLRGVYDLEQPWCQLDLTGAGNDRELVGQAGHRLGLHEQLAAMRVEVEEAAGERVLRVDLFAEDLDGPAHTLQRDGVLVAVVRQQPRLDELPPGHPASVEAFAAQNRLVLLAATVVAVQPAVRRSPT